MKIATSAYPVTWLETPQDYEQKLASWVGDAAAQGADLLVFPEYAGMELSALAGEQAASDRAQSLRAVADHFDLIETTHRELAKRHGVHILSGSAPALLGGSYVNRAGLFAPNGDVVWQDKQIMTRFEREDWGVEGGGPLQIVDTDLGRIGILICYDSEFPLLGRALKDVDLLLVPSCTEAEAGYWRVRIGAMARALELQCVSVMSSLLSEETRFYGVDEGTGAGGVFGPPDTGFPSNGVIALGDMNVAGWTYAEVDIARIAHVRADGVVLNRLHWSEQTPRDQNVEENDMRQKDT